MSPNNALHSDGPRVARPAGERGRYADCDLLGGDGRPAAGVRHARGV